MNVLLASSTIFLVFNLSLEQFNDAKHTVVCLRHLNAYKRIFLPQQKCNDSNISKNMDSTP